MAQCVTRFGRNVAVDEVYLAWSSNDVCRMKAALAIPTNEVDRHYLLSSLVGLLYQQRQDQAARAELLEVAELHMRELPALVKALRRHDIECRAAQEADLRRRASRGRQVVELPPREVGVLPVIETFERLATVYGELGNEESARDVWQRAVALGYLQEPASTAAVGGANSATSSRLKRPVKPEDP